MSLAATLVQHLRRPRSIYLLPLLYNSNNSVCFIALLQHLNRPHIVFCPGAVRMSKTVWASTVEKVAAHVTTVFCSRYNMGLLTHNIFE